MSGNSLMCVWQAVAATNPSVTGGAPVAFVKAITKEFAKPPKFRFSDSAFRNVFTTDRVDFESYRVFVRTEVIQNTTPLHIAEADVEKICWEKCKDAYKFGVRSCVTLDDTFKLWQMFNRICMSGTCPPVVSVSDMNWFANKISTPMAKQWSDLPANSEPLSFVDVLKTLNERVFSRDSLTDAQRSIEQLHGWLVQEISNTGWMFKRTRKQGNNWTTWQRRYFILAPGELRYYNSARASDKDFKGKVSITMHSRLESLPDYKSLARKYANRVRLSNVPVLEIELSSVTQHEKKAWLAAVEEVIEACKAGTTPVQAVLEDRRKRNKEAGPKETIDQAMSRLKSVRLSSVPTKLLSQDEPNSRSQRPKALDEEPAQTSQSSMEEYDEDDEEFDNNNYTFQKQKVQTLFNRIDKNGNGLLTEREFDEFLRILVGKSTNVTGISVSTAIFADIDEDGDQQINFDEFYSYFTKLVLDPNPGSEAEAVLKEELLKADSEGNAALNFGDLSEFVWERRRSFRYQGLMNAFEKMDARMQGGDQFPQLKEFVIGQCGPINDAQMRSNDMYSSSELGRQIRNIQGEEDTTAVASTLTQQWMDFVKAMGLTATDPQRIATHYNLIDVVCFTKEKGQEPKKLTVEAARWESVPDPNAPADLIFPVDAPSKIPVLDATDDYLKYFGCRLADEDQEQIATLYQHKIKDMSYTNQGFSSLPGGIGGPGIEKSSMCRFICPQSYQCGYLILARWEGDEEILEATAFIVSANVSVYIPAGTMYSLDYLKGSWRMIVGDDVKIDFAYIKRQLTPDNDRDLENVMLEFCN